MAVRVGAVCEQKVDDVQMLHHNGKLQWRVVVGRVCYRANKRLCKGSQGDVCLLKKQLDTLDAAHTGSNMERRYSVVVGLGSVTFQLDHVL